VRGCAVTSAKVRLTLPDHLWRNTGTESSDVEGITTGVVYSLPGDIRPRLAITARSSSGSTGFAKCT
jgi:hypothetical protein